MAERDLVLTWLRNAHAMEKALEEVLQRHVEDAQAHADIQSGLESHLDETRRHAEQVAECIDAMGGKVSKAKDVFANMFGAIEGMMGKPYKDKMVKDVVTDIAAEQFEIASYRALSEAARQIGEEKVARVCDEICAQEEDMARWLELQLPTAVRDALTRARGD